MAAGAAATASWGAAELRGGAARRGGGAGRSRAAPNWCGEGRGARDHEGPCASAWRAGRRQLAAPVDAGPRPHPCDTSGLAYYRGPPYSYIQGARRRDTAAWRHPQAGRKRRGLCDSVVRTQRQDDSWGQRQK